MSSGQARPVPRAGDRPHSGAMLRVVSNWVRDEIYSAVVAAGFDDLNPAHLAMFRYPGLDGMSPSLMAGELQVTKQAVNSLVGDLERRGYIVRAPNPADARGRVIRLTARGHRLESAVHAQAKLADDRIADIVGPAGFARLLAELGKLFQHITEPGNPPLPLDRKRDEADAF